MLLVEHHMGMVMRISDHVVVLDFGREIADGTPAEVQRTTAVIEAYLGRRREPARGRGLRGRLRPGDRPARTLLQRRGGQVVTMLGANGAGKTTTLRALSRHGRARAGSVRFDGTRLSRPRPSGSCGAGSPTCPRAAARSPADRRGEPALGAYARRTAACART
jgi:ABC-type branched-subunit amino acid transport system ATPase component